MMPSVLLTTMNACVDGQLWCSGCRALSQTWVKKIVLIAVSACVATFASVCWGKVRGLFRAISPRRNDKLQCILMYRRAPNSMTWARYGELCLGVGCSFHACNVNVDCIAPATACQVLSKNPTNAWFSTPGSPQ